MTKPGVNPIALVGSRFPDLLRALNVFRKFFGGEMLLVVVFLLLLLLLCVNMFLLLLIFVFDAVTIVFICPESCICGDALFRGKFSPTYSILKPPFIP